MEQFKVSSYSRMSNDEYSNWCTRDFGENDKEYIEFLNYELSLLLKYYKVEDFLSNDVKIL